MRADKQLSMRSQAGWSQRNFYWLGDLYDFLHRLPSARRNTSLPRLCLNRKCQPCEGGGTIPRTIKFNLCEREKRTRMSRRQLVLKLLTPLSAHRQYSLLSLNLVRVCGWRASARQQVACVW